MKGSDLQAGQRADGIGKADGKRWQRWQRWPQVFQAG